MKIHNGTIYGIYKNQLIYQPKLSSLPNANTFIVSGPGGAKTTGYVIPNVLMDTKRSIVVTDPKGEVYAATVKIKEKQGYSVFVLNYDNMYQSMRNNPLLYVETQRDAITISELIVASKNDTKNKDIWYNTQVSLLTALILYFCYEKPIKLRTIPGILSFLQEMDMEQDEETGLSPLDIVFLELEKGHPARKAYEMGFGKSKSKTRSSIAISILTTLSNYLDNEVEYFMSNSDFILDEIAIQKSILYIITPAMDESWDSIVNLTYSQLFQRLYKVAKLNNLKVPIPVVIWADEFPNLGKLEKAQRFMATCRGFDISMNIIIQNITQLYTVYGKDDAESLIGNCAVKIHLGNCNNTTNQYFADMCGKATVKVQTGGTSSSKGSNNRSTSESQNYNYVQRYLIAPDEIDSMDEEELIMKTAFHHPIKLKKFKVFDFFPNEIMEKYKTDALSFQPYTTQYAKDYYKKQKKLKVQKPQKRKGI